MLRLRICHFFGMFIRVPCFRTEVIHNGQAKQADSIPANGCTAGKMTGSCDHIADTLFGGQATSELFAYIWSSLTEGSLRKIH